MIHRLPLLHVSRQDPEIIRNLAERINEARLNGWLGEVHGLQTSLEAAKTKLTSLDRQPTAPPGTLTDLGIPVLSAPRTSDQGRRDHHPTR